MSVFTDPGYLAQLKKAKEEATPSPKGIVPFWRIINAELSRSGFRELTYGEIAKVWEETKASARRTLNGR